MSCRERSRQAKSTDSTQCLDSRKERRETIGRKKKEDPLKPNHAEEKPPVKEATKEKGKHLTREHSREQQTPPETTKTKISSSRSTSVKTPPLHRDLVSPSLHRQLESQATTMRSKTAKASLKTTKPKACGKAETPTRCTTEAPGKMEGAQLKEKKSERPSGGKKETAAEKSCDTEHADKIKPKMLKTRSVSVDCVLKSTLEKLKIRVKDKSDTCKIVNDFIENLIRHLKKETICFQNVDEPVRTGSYYENLKISDPDEFDIMLPMPVRVQNEPFGENGAFYSVALKRGNSRLMKFQQNDVLSASEMLQEFRNEVKKFAKGFPAWMIEKKKGGCPAVTLTHKVGSVTISLDVVLCLKVASSWPPFTSNGLKIDQWLGTKVKQEYKRKPYYLVPKYEGRGNVENDGVLNKDVWRISFSHIEKDIIKKHGSEKTCCESGGASCCRKYCLKLLKHLLHLLKESNPSFAKFCSYHAKTTLLHACCSRTRDSDWGGSDLSRCFGLLLQDFESHLRRGELYNFFIPSQNLLSGLGKASCKLLADCVKEQRENGYPIFDAYLQSPC